MGSLSFAEATRCLGWDLLHHVSGLSLDKKVDATALSPVSIIMAISMLAGAADPGRKASWDQKLRISGSLTTAVEEMQAQLTRSAGQDAVSLANAVFVDTGVELFPEYSGFLESLQVVVKQYPSIPGAVKEINSWISQNTEGRINNMLEASGLLNSHTVLVNALAFSGTWQVKFNPEKTAPNYQFLLEDGTKRTVDMMFLHGQSIETASRDDFKAVRLPYTSSPGMEGWSLVAYLPNEGVVLEDLVRHLSADAPKLSFRKKKYTQFGLPKFKVESSFSIIGELDKIGFPIGGNYPGMGKGSNEVSDVVHKAFVKLNEEGTEAAAATAIIMSRSRPAASQVEVLIFNRPFLYSIDSQETGVPIMCGAFSVA